MSAVVELLKARASEEAAWIENERRDREARKAAHDHEKKDREATEAASFVTDFFDGITVITPADLNRIERLGWKAAWAFRVDDFDLEVRRNAFHGLRLMNGERDGDGRLIHIIADLVEPTSSECRSAARQAA